MDSEPQYNLDPIQTAWVERVGRDKSRMKYSDRYPRLIIRIGDELLGEMEKEIKKSGMNSSEITKKVLSEYFERSRVAN